MIAAVDYSQIGVYAAGAVLAAGAFVNSLKSKWASKATKVIVEESVANPQLTAEVLAAVLAPVLAKVQVMLDGVATKDALDIFSARHDAFRQSIMLEIGRISESGRALGDQFPKFEQKLNEKVDRVATDLTARIDQAHARIAEVADAAKAAEAAIVVVADTAAATAA